MTRNRWMTLVAAASLVAILALAAGCGGGGDEPAAEAEQAAPAEGATEVTTHDCAGGCGMTAVPADQMTEIDGKYYCAGCAAKVQEGGHDHDDHDGHDHG